MATFSITLTFTPSLGVTAHFDVSKKNSLTNDDVVNKLKKSTEAKRDPLTRDFLKFTLAGDVSLNVYEIDGKEPDGELVLSGSRWQGFSEALRQTERSMSIEWYRKLSLYKGMSDSETKCIARPSFNSSVDRFSATLALFVDLTTSIVVNSAGIAVTEELFLKSFAKEISLHVLPKCASYSTLSPFAFQQLVSITEGPERKGKRKANEAGIDNPRDLLESMRGAGGARLENAINAVKASLEEQPEEVKAKWGRLCSLVHSKLLLLNQSYEPGEHLEQSRRLVINEFITAVTNFCGMTFSVETSLFEERHKGEAGWGPLDYFLFQSVTAGGRTAASRYISSSGPAVRNGLIIAVSTEEEEIQSVQQEELQEEKVVLTQTDGALWSLLTERMDREELADTLRDIEAKRVFSGQTLTQLGAQLYDRIMDSKRYDPSKAYALYGCLCTGHRWLFVEMAISDAADDETPTYTYLGEVQVAVLRGAAHERRGSTHSGCAFDELTVDMEKVKTVMLALLASLTVYL